MPFGLIYGKSQKSIIHVSLRENRFIQSGKMS